MPSDILIQPNRGSTTLNPIIFFSGSAANNSIRLETLPSGSVAFLGKSGSLFSIVDSMSGSLMAVSDVSGLPILEVFSDDRVVMGKFNSKALVVTGSFVGIGKSTPSVVLDASGSVNVTGSIAITTDWGYTAYATPIFRMSNSQNDPAVLIDAYTNNTPGTYASQGLGGSVRMLFKPVGSYFGIVGTDNACPLIFVTNASPRIYLSSGGDVAIGKTTANSPFDVNGNTIITGSLTVTGTITGTIGSAQDPDFTPSFMLMGA